MKIILFLLGCLIGVLVSYIYRKLHKPKTSGTFVMDFSDPTRDACRLVLEENLNDIYKKKYMILQIETHESQAL